MQTIKTLSFRAICILLLGLLCNISFAKIIYVDDDAAGTNNGTSWENAYVYLQDALADAVTAEKPVEIRVAQGIYTPNKGANQTPGERMATFQLINGVTIAGGFAGLNMPDPNANDIEMYKTILSGDLNSDDLEDVSPSDLPNESTRAENSYHVVRGSSTNETAILDGFIITSGNANGPDQTQYPFGGGMYNENCNPTIRNCTFSENSALIAGGGICNRSCNSTLTDCTFISNRASDDGGGMFNDNSCPDLTNCTFTSNSAGGSGGAIRNKAMSTGTFTNCTFSSNTAANSGGGMDNSITDAENTGSNTQLNNCLFEKNTAIYGGGMSCYTSSPILTNCTFRENSVYYTGPTTRNHVNVQRSKQQPNLDQLYICYKRVRRRRRWDV